MIVSRIPEFARRFALASLLIAAGVFAAFPWLPNALRWPLRLLFFGAALVAVAGLALRFARAIRNPKRVIFAAAALFFGLLIAYGLLEVASVVYLRSDPDRNTNPFVLTKAQRKAIGKLVQGEPEYTAFDATLGWGIKPNGVSADGLFHANAAGFRASREYTKSKPESIVRAICFGDSYTHGNSVGNDETWQHYAEQSADNREFLNFGVGGYGMAQAYLRYRKRKGDYETDWVVIGCMSDNIRRTVNVYYPFRLNRLDATTFALTKPWSSLDRKGRLVLHPNPLPSLAAYEAFLEEPAKKMRRMAGQDLLFETPAPTPFLTVMTEYAASNDLEFLEDRWNGLTDREPDRKPPSKSRKPSAFSRDSEIFRINCRLFEEFVREVESDGARPVILWFPSPKDVGRLNERGTRIYRSFLDFFQEKGLPYLDSLDWIAAAYGPEGEIPAETVFLEGHYAPAVNRLIGERLVEFLDTGPG